MEKIRRYDMDWLRVLAMLTIFFYHCARFFGTEGWHLKNAEQSSILVMIRGVLIWPWIMELFFLLSGVGAWYALKRRTGGAFIWERIKRLLIPFYTVGLLILLPPQFYFELFTNSGYPGNFWQMLPGYFKGLHLPALTAYPDTLIPIPFGGHLWFIQFLFLISLVALPLLFFLKSKKGQEIITRLATLTNKSGGIFLFLIPLILVQICLGPIFKGSRTFTEFFWYAVYFLIGYIIAADDRFTGAIKKYGWISLVPWFVGLIGIGILVFGIKINPMPGQEPFSLLFALFKLSWTLMSWSSIIFILNLAARYLNKNQKILAYANEAVLPFYLFHQTIILCVGWFVLPLEMNALIKFIIIAVVSFLLIMALYELLVRRFNPLRFLFGMRSKKKLTP